MNNSSNATTDSGQAPVIITAVDWVYIVLAIPGVLLSGCVIGIGSKKNIISGRIPRMFLINQCCSDAACCFVRAVTLLFAKTLVVPPNAFGTFLCRIVLPETLYWSLIQVSENSFVLLTVEQYVSVVHHKMHSRFKPWLSWLFIALCWILGFFYQTGSFLEADREGSSCVQAYLDPVAFKVYGIEQFITGYILPLVLMLYFYTRIILTLRHSSERMADQSRQAVAFRRIQRDMSYTVCILGCAFLVLFAPSVFTYFLYTMSYIDLDYEGWFYQLLMFFVNFFFLVSPLSYMIRMRSFRNAIAELLCCRKSVDATAQGNTSTTGTRDTATV